MSLKTVREGNRQPSARIRGGGGARQMQISDEPAVFFPDLQASVKASGIPKVREESESSPGFCSPLCLCVAKWKTGGHCCVF